MNTIEAIAARRSIRAFKDEELPEETVTKILTAASRAPSGKNRQPWRFAVLTTEARTHLADLIDRSCQAIRSAGGEVGSAPGTAQVIRQAPVTIVIFETPIPPEWKNFESGMRIVDVQSIGAAIQNMCLAAVELGLGSLWIADVLYAEDTISRWLGRPEERLVAALSIGYPDESPDPRSRKPLDEVVEWRSEASA